MVSESIKKVFSILNIFFNSFSIEFFSTEECGVTPHCLYRDSSHLSPLNLLFLDLAWSSVIYDISLPHKQSCNMNLKWLYLKIYYYSKYSSYPPETVQIIKGGPEMSKNYLAPLKPKFLFLALLLCLIQMQKQHQCSHSYLQVTF